jgi:hypothetical protein
MGQRCGFSGCFDLTEGLGHAVESELMKEIESWTASPRCAVSQAL